MKNITHSLALVFTGLSFTAPAPAQDWPQWLGANRDAHAADFQTPKTWPKELAQQWKVTVGEGVATPALVGDKLFVFSREQGREITRCLDAATGKELWQEGYESLGATGPAGGFSGPRSSPAAADGKVVTLGVRGMISALDAATGKKLWRKDEFNAYPNFHPSSSPLIVDGLAIAQLGGRENGALVAYDLASGTPKWKWSGPSPSYASPTLMTVGGTKLIIAQTESKLVAIKVADGSLAWESAPPVGGGGGRGSERGMGGGMNYKAATPIVDGQTLIMAGRGFSAVKIEKVGDKFEGKELWSNADKSVSFNTPALKGGLIYGLAGNNEIFCLSAKDGKTAWSAPWPVVNGTASVPGRGALELPVFSANMFGLQAPADPGAPGRPPGQGGQPGGFRGPGGPGGGQGGQPGGPGGPGGQGGGRRGGGGMGGGGGYGSIIDAGSVLFALTPAAQLLVFEPSDKEFKQLASYKVSSTQTHAYPVASGRRLYIKDKDSVILWTVN